MSIKKNRFDLDAQSASVIAKLAKLNEQRQELLAQLASGEDVTDAIDASNGEIAELEQKLTTFKAVRAAKAVANSDAARKERHARNAAKVKSAREKGKYLAHLSAEVLKHIGELGKKLVEIEKVHSDFTTDLHDVLLSTSGAVPDRIVSNGQEVVNYAARALTLPGHYQAALYNAGVGQRGVYVPGVQIERLSPPDNDLSSRYEDPTDAIERALKKLDGVIASVAGISERANAAPKAA